MFATIEELYTWGKDTAQPVSQIEGNDIRPVWAQWKTNFRAASTSSIGANKAEARFTGNRWICRPISQAGTPSLLPYTAAPRSFSRASHRMFACVYTQPGNACQDAFPWLYQGSHARLALLTSFVACCSVNNGGVGWTTTLSSRMMSRKTLGWDDKMH